MRSAVLPVAVLRRILHFGVFMLLAGLPPGLTGAFSATEAAGPAPEVEIKKHATGKEATLRAGEKEWFIHVDVDQDRTMILRTESDKGQEKSNQAEIIERPMSNTEVDHVVNDFLSGIKSTLKP
jgi:hypothetical protein